jgi:PAS domain S-box-containing protein
MAETVPGILFASSPEGGCDYLSPRFHEYTGLTAEAALGLGWAEALHPDDKKRILAARQLAAPTGESFAEECRIRAADGTYRWFVARWRPIHDAVGRTQKWIGAITDIDELKRGAEELRSLTSQLLAAQDSERRRIARDLHDSTAQNLAAVSLNIGRALRLIPDIAVPATSALQESHQLIEQSQREIRTLSYLLHPPMLDEAGLPSALGWYVEGFSKRSGIAVSLEVSPELTERRLLTEVETALFRVVQEGLSNVRRHSGSSTARIHLALEQAPSSGESIVTLEIADAGRGISKEAVDPVFEGGKPGDAVRPALGVGVASMRERVRQLGGSLEIQPNGHGMSVRAIVPLDDNHAETPAENPTLNDGRAHISPPTLRVRG